MIESYISYIKYSKGYSQHTIRGHKTALNKFNKYLNNLGKGIINPSEITLIDALNFIENLSKSGLCPGSIACVLKGVKGYLKYCRNVLELDVIDPQKIPLPKVANKEIGFFSRREKEIILDIANKGFGFKKITQMRNRLLVYLFLHTGLRIHEMAKIKVNEIGESLQVVGKGGKRRFVYLRGELLEMIKEYLSQREKKSEYLFPSGFKKGGHLSTDQIGHIFYNMSKKAGIHIHAHKFRHTFACDLLRIPGGNIYSIAKLLGHSNIATTQVYLGVDSPELKNLQFSLEI